MATIPNVIDGVTNNFSTDGANSLAINEADGLLYFASSTSADSNTGLYAYNMRTNTFSQLESDMSTRGVTFEGVGMGSGAAFFEPTQRRLYFGIENDLAGSPYDSYVYSIAVNSSGLLFGNVSLELQFLMGWGDIAVSGNTLYSGHTTYNFSLGVWEDHYTQWNLGTLQSQGDETQTVDNLKSFGQFGSDLSGNYYFVTGNTAVFSPIDLATGNQGTSKNMTFNGVTNVTTGSYDAAGVVPHDSSIGDLIWNDVNGDGVKQAGESGIPGVTIQIYDDIDGDGNIDNGGSYNNTDRLLATDTTDANGNYKFNGLLPGDYIIVITDSNGVLVNGSYSTNGGSTQVASIISSQQFVETSDFGYILPTADLSVSKTLVTQTPYISKQPVTYTLTVSNAGPDSATNVVVNDLPTNLTVTSASGTDSSCVISPTSGVTTSVTCSIATLGVGALNEKTITIMATVP
ncbi:SdrD B-like domain-containing protein [uncultured Cocleimonas sp.]|uniref:SdrD B-like domain-containing protein n=1 Tax=uncultured Cocleimonas sp. TaxID=1051587 RepID=UPI00260853B3|nr:SdrD B-like domain-containing protein [uncultured Cocleimonas sp.]